MVRKTAIRVTMVLSTLLGFVSFSGLDAGGAEIGYYQIIGGTRVESYSEEIGHQYQDIENLYVRRDSNNIEISFYYPGRGTYVVKINDYDFYSEDGDPAEVYLNGILQQQNRYFGYIEGFTMTGGMGHVKLGLYSENSQYNTILIYSYSEELSNRFTGISSGIYGGTGNATVDTAFGTFNLGELPKTKINVAVSDNILDLSFQAKGQMYTVQAQLLTIDENGVSTYNYSDENEQWDVIVDREGNLTGTLILSNDRGTMNFKMELISK